MYWVVWWSWFARVNALCNLSRKKLREVTASLPGRFLSRRCFTLCITMEVEPRIVKQYKCHHCCSSKNYGEREWRVKKKKSLHRFLAYQIASSWKKCVWGHLLARTTSYCLLPDTFWRRASQNAFKVGSVKFTYSLLPPSIVKQVCTGSKSSQGTEAMLSRELTTLPEPPSRHNSCYPSTYGISFIIILLILKCMIMMHKGPSWCALIAHILI